MRLKLPSTAPPCTILCGKRLTRWHATCLTCPQRRIYYGKTAAWQRWKKLTITMEAGTDKGFVMPAHARTYCVTFPKGIGKVRKKLLKVMLTITERIAEW